MNQNLKRVYYTKCTCKGVGMGTHTNSLGMQLFHKEYTKWVDVDTCIATHIGWLWHQGIRTLASCCGHKKIRPSVAVTSEYSETMQKMGYEVQLWEGMDEEVKGCCFYLD